MNIGNFNVNASGTLTKDQSSSLTKDNTTTTTKSTQTTVKAGKSLTVTTIVSTTSRVDVYRTKIEIRGKLNQPTLNVPPINGKFSDLGTWVAVDALPGIGPASEGFAEFSIKTTEKDTTVHLKEEDLPKNPAVVKKLPAHPPAFKRLNLAVEV
jgi:hypothetical protein